MEDGASVVFCAYLDAPTTIGTLIAPNSSTLIAVKSGSSAPAIGAVESAARADAIASIDSSIPAQKRPPLRPDSARLVSTEQSKLLLPVNRGLAPFLENS